MLGNIMSLPNVYTEKPRLSSHVTFHTIHLSFTVCIGENPGPIPVSRPSRYIRVIGRWSVSYLHSRYFSEKQTMRRRRRLSAPLALKNQHLVKNMATIYANLTARGPEDIYRPVIMTARSLYRCLLSCKDAFPSSNMKDEWVVGVWNEACFRTRER
jgi:hypothetical protein